MLFEVGGLSDKVEVASRWCEEMGAETIGDLGFGYHDGVAENRLAWQALEQWDKPFLTLWCPGDRVLGHLGDEFVERVPGAARQPHQRLEPGGHFLQDDRGEDVAAALVNWLAQP